MFLTLNRIKDVPAAFFFLKRKMLFLTPDRVGTIMLNRIGLSVPEGAKARMRD
jgi:hypothetical protein